jgi:hypothetical protein|tara:strand:- start:1893 stop:2387 length:495 start_codon:yes stop_codon:yes gene_type:complete
MKAEYDIRTMTLDDSEDIIDLVQESFKDAKTFYLPVLPTKKTAYHFYKLEIEPAIINRDPCHVVLSGDECIGFSCSSTCINKVYDLDKKIALGVLTFILKNHRRQGLSEELRYLTMKGLKELEAEYVLCDIYEPNKPSLLGMKKICEESNLNPELIFERYGCKL